MWSIIATNGSHQLSRNQFNFVCHLVLSIREQMLRCRCGFEGEFEDGQLPSYRTLYGKVRRILSTSFALPFKTATLHVDATKAGTRANSAMKDDVYSTKINFVPISEFAAFDAACPVQSELFLRS